MADTPVKPWLRPFEEVGEPYLSTEVVICGYGGAGASAALEARRAGADVLVLERASGGGGATAMSSCEMYLGGSGGTGAAGTGGASTGAGGGNEGGASGAGGVGNGGSAGAGGGNEGGTSGTGAVGGGGSTGSCPTVDFGTWWFNLRASNTEPLLRLNLEAPTAEEVATRVAEVQALMA